MARRDPAGLRKRLAGLLPVCLLLACVAGRVGATASPAPPSEARRQLDRIEGFRLQQRYAAMESLATIVRLDLEKSTHPDTALLAEAWYDICAARVFSRLLSDSVAVHAGTRCLALLDASGGGPDTLRLTAHQALGWVYVHTGRSSEALDHYRRAVDVTHRHPEWSVMSVTGLLYDMGMTLIVVGKTDSALAIFASALAQRTALNLPRDGVIGDLHAGIATAYEHQKRPALAEQAYAAAIRAHEARLGHDSPRMLNALSRAAAFEFMRGDYSRSVDYNQRALLITLAQAHPSQLDVLTFRMALAQGLEQLGDAEGARSTYEAIMPGIEKWLGPSAPLVFAGWISLAGAASKLGEGDRALEIYRHIRAAYAADSTLTDKLPLASATLNMAMILGDRAPTDSALAFAIEAAELARPLGSSDLGFYLSALCTEMINYGRRGDWASVDRVDAEVQQELDRYAVRENNQSDDVFLNRSEMAGLRGRPEAAVAFAADGARAARKRLTWNVRALSDRQALMLANNVSGPLDRLLQLAAGAGPATVRMAWDELIRTRGLVGAEISRRRLPPAAADSALVRAHAEWIAAQEKLAQQEVQLAASLRDSAAEAERDVLRARVDECERRLVRAASDARPELDAGQVGLDQVLEALTPGRALVGLAGAPDAHGVRRLLAFVVTGKTASPVCLDLGAADSLEALIAVWKAALGQPDPGRRSESACRRAGAAVARAVWAPLARATAGCRELVLVPEAPVAGLPWGALPAAHAGYLVETGPVFHILATERELLPPALPPAGRGLLAVGGIDYGERVGGASGTLRGAVRSPRAAGTECDSLALSRLQPLPGTAAEVSDVQAALSGGAQAAEPVTLLKGPAAAEAEFKRLAPGRRLIHIATHGLALVEECGPAVAGTRGVGGVSPVERPSAGTAPASGARARRKDAGTPARTSPAFHRPSPWLDRQVFLAFAGAAHALNDATDENEGLLTAQEVATLDLRGTEWVVLSACHSAAGRSWSRQGVLGMERAFHLAGARTVIASQWSVDDESTREWMRALYEARVGGGANPGESMTRADRQVLRLRRAAGRSTHPFYWAAFTASGE